jgi:hypothetical protein
LCRYGSRGPLARPDFVFPELLEEGPRFEAVGLGHPLLECPVRNVHFRDRLENGRMTFDYRMREGVVDSTNALRVLAEAGVPISPDAVRAGSA